MFSGKNVLVTGATGMIGRQLLPKLNVLGANITAVSLEDPTSLDSRYKALADFKRLDLRNIDNCIQVTKGQNIVFHLAGVKGSPLLTQTKPASFFTNTMMFNLNIMESSRINGIEKFLYTSSIGVYAPSKKFVEEDVWSTFPSENDKFAGYAKRMGELQSAALEIEYGWKAVHIVRPANVYGTWDNFDVNTAMVIPALISRVANGENPLNVWGDGSAIRDFIHSQDVASAMIHVMKNNIRGPINLGSGEKVSIRDIANILKGLVPGLEIEWQIGQPKGDDIRLMDVTLLNNSGFKPKISIEEGIADTFRWYKANMSETSKRYNAFTEGGYLKDGNLN